MQRFVLLLLASTGLAACNGAPSAGDTSTSSSALTTTSDSSALAVGQRVHLTFELAAPSEVAEVAICQDTMGPCFGSMHGDRGFGMMQGQGSTTDPAARGRLFGAVDSVDGTASTLSILGVTVTVDASTVFGGVTALADVQAGMLADVRVTVGSDGSIVADALRVRAPELAGTITAVSTDSGTTITVLGRAITLSSDTSVVIVTPPADMGGDHHGHGGMMGGSGSGDGTGSGTGTTSGSGGMMGGSGGGMMGGGMGGHG